MHPTKQNNPTIPSNITGSKTISDVLMTPPAAWLTPFRPSRSRCSHSLRIAFSVIALSVVEVRKNGKRLERGLVDRDVLDRPDERKQRTCRIGTGRLTGRVHPARQVGRS